MKNEQAPISDPQIRAEGRRLSDELLGFLDASPCAVFAVVELERRLRDAGFQALSEADPFEIARGGRYYLRRHDTSLVALRIGDLPPSAAGFRIVGAHTDSPGFRVKPSPEVEDHGLVHLGVEVYGGPIAATWTDRDLGLCGQVHLAVDGGIATRTWRSTEPMVCLPNLAIHQNREVNEQGLKLNPQTELCAILGSVAEGLPREGALRWILARELGVEADRVLDFDLFLHDTQPASYGGFAREFVRSGRLDDLALCHASATALATASSSAWTQVVLLCNHEEIGSNTAQGAQSNLLAAVLERVAVALGDGREGFLAALARSLAVSADQAHGVHPGFGAKMEPRHAPVLNGGPVVKAHAGRAYATDGYTAAVFEQACRRAGVPCQRFVNRSDVQSGRTIGSMMSAQIGVRTVDVGNPIYAMHSVREMGGTWDHAYMTGALRAFLAG